MQIRFSTINAAKKSAKALASVLDSISLSIAQRAVARLSGCRDWHELETRYKRGTLEGPPELLSSPEERLRVIEGVAFRLSIELGTDWSTALYALSISHLPGIRLESSAEYERIWLKLMRQVYEFASYREAPGNIVRLKVAGWTGANFGFLRTYGRPSLVVTHGSIETGVADFEVVFPRNPVESFIPARLKYAYGCWTEKDGAKVLFSRDYKPMWRLREGRRPKRLQPWLWIDKVEEEWFWEDVNPPWDDRSRQAEEDARLDDYGITALPKLTDILPEVILKPELHNVGDAVDAMAKRQEPNAVETFHGVFKIPQSLDEERPV